MPAGSLSDMYSTVFHSLLFWMVVVQAVFVGLLIMPLPSNYIRGMIIKSIDNIWTLSPHFQQLCVVLTAILALIFVSSVHAWLTLNNVDISDPIFAADERERARCSIVEAERNIYMTGFSLYLNCVAIRLMQVNRQLFESRQELKAFQASVGYDAEVKKELKKTK